MNTKYTLIKSDKTAEGKPLFQVKAKKSFGIIANGELGGYIESEKNLSVYGNAWVSGNARVSGDALVYGNARVYGNALVYGDAWVSGDARVYGNALVSGDALVYGNALVSGDARVYGKIKITFGYFFGFKTKETKMIEIDNGDGTILIGKE